MVCPPRCQATNRSATFITATAISIPVECRNHRSPLSITGSGALDIVLHPPDSTAIHRPKVTHWKVSLKIIFCFSELTILYTGRHPLEPSSPSMMSRGPPLKPRRSGHALWVGNLHPATSVIALKNHFSQHMTDDIESVFLISRSTCAFVNYRSEQACKLALVRFHSSRLNGNNVVCRIRREPGADRGLGLLSLSSAERSDSSGENSNKDNAPNSPTTPVIVGMQNATISSPPTTPARLSPKVPTKFFILKSLTVQDLEASVRKSSWVTQAKNEAALNDAFREAETVYLIFSANRSGEYFGFARMTSAISADESRLSTMPSNEPVERSPLMTPTYIHTPATASAPSGRIVDDSARGTLFWEAGSSKEDESEDKYSEGSSTLSTEGIREENMGKVFGVEWLCISRLPFICTRGLRNPWNANREVCVFAGCQHLMCDFAVSGENNSLRCEVPYHTHVFPRTSTS